MKQKNVENGGKQYVYDKGSSNEKYAWGKRNRLGALEQGQR